MYSAAIRLPAAMCLASAMLLAACTTEDSAPTPPASSAPSAAPSASEDAAFKLARAEVLIAYDGYQRAVMAASLKGDYEAKALADFTAEPLLGQTRNSIYQIKQAGLINKGERRWSPQVVDLQLDDEPQTAKVEDCTDTSKWIVVVRKTGKPAPAPSGRPTKYLVTSTAKKVSGKWYIAESTGDWERPC